MRRMTLTYARQLAAQAWCEPTTSKKIMDVELAEEFAKILVRECEEFEVDRRIIENKFIESLESKKK